MKKYAKTKWGCCKGREHELLDQGYAVPCGSSTDRQIILQMIDHHAGMALRCRREELKEEHGYSKGFVAGSALTHELAAAGLAVNAGIASDTYRSAERLKHFRAWGSRVRSGGPKLFGESPNAAEPTATVALPSAVAA